MTTEENSIYPNVLTLTILDDATMSNAQITEETKILICVRNPNVNETHPEVVSVPTMRMPDSLANDILSGSSQIGKQDKTILLSGETVSNRSTQGHDPIIYAVESLMCRKLGVTDALELDELTFDAKIAASHVGIAEYANLESSEHLNMINVLVLVTKGASQLPPKTASYDESRWATIAGFRQSWETKDPHPVGLSAEQALRGVCVKGLCILSTYDVVSAMLESRTTAQ